MDDIKEGDWITCDNGLTKYRVLDVNEYGLFARSKNDIYLEGYSRHSGWTKCKPPQSHYPYIIVVAALIIGLVYFNWGW